MTTYSTQFALGSATSAAGVFTAAAGFVYVLRDFSLFLASGTSTPACLVSVGNPGSDLFFYTSGTFDPDGMRHWEGRLVFTAGQRLAIWPSGGPVHYVFSGYQLTL